MENRSHALIAGLFALLLGASAIASIWWFGGQREATQDFIVVARQNVTGLSPQAQVRYRGIGVGKVQSIRLDPDDIRNILIRIRVDSEVPVTRGTTARLGYQGVTGIAHVLLEESGRDPAPLADGSGKPPRIAMQASLIEELSDVGGETMRQARDFLAAANELLKPENRARISRTLASLEAATARAEQVLAGVERVLSPANLERVERLLVNAEAASAQALPVAGEARELIGRLRAATGKLDLALGDPVETAALVPRINALSDELSQSSRQLSRILRMLEETPESLIFGTPRASPGPGEPGFVPPVPARENP
ncbi:MAG: MlaD family protein [Proteobacteria bacterium]|nr:MlaD family protein [Pseudomonadota bacterium]